MFSSYCIDIFHFGIVPASAFRFHNFKDDLVDYKQHLTAANLGMGATAMFPVPGRI